MAYDLVIKNGIVVDGTGATRRQADVAIANGKVAEIGKVTEGAKRTIEIGVSCAAAGIIVVAAGYSAAFLTLAAVAAAGLALFVALMPETGPATPRHRLAPAPPTA